VDSDRGPRSSTTDHRRRLRLRYRDVCVACGTALTAGTDAFYDGALKTVCCISCPIQADQAEQPLDHGIAGGSARREFERRAEKRAVETKGRIGSRLGGLVVALTDEPQSTRAWAKGAQGEEKLAKSLAGVPSIKVLNDRRVAGRRGNIDHLVIAPGGVFVVDAKQYKGLIQIRDRGGLFRKDERLYVGGHDCSHLAENMGWQVAVVEIALRTIGLDPVPPVFPVLCFVDGDWPMFRPPASYRGVRLEGTHSLRKLVLAGNALDTLAIERVTRVLANALPSK
jgi:Nuclease-related domain